MGKKLYVGNISFQATEKDITDLFSQAGDVESVKLITDSHTGQPRGFGFVEMSSEEGVQKAISMFNGKNFMDRSLVVNEARPQERRERGGFRERGGGFGSRGGRRR